MHAWNEWIFNIEMIFSGKAAKERVEFVRALYRSIEAASSNFNKTTLIEELAKRKITAALAQKILTSSNSVVAIEDCATSCQGAAKSLLKMLARILYIQQLSPLGIVDSALLGKTVEAFRLTYVSEIHLGCGAGRLRLGIGTMISSLIVGLIYVLAITTVPSNAFEAGLGLAMTLVFMGIAYVFIYRLIFVREVTAQTLLNAL